MRPVSASIVGAVLALVLAPAALADWDHPVKWDQLEPDAGISVFPSGIVSDSMWVLTADDFPCRETGWITDIEFNGLTLQGNESISSFRITFWSDVPATANEESHPGDQPLHTVELGKVDPTDLLGLGWQAIDEYTYKINIPEELWFLQREGNTYWIGIQAVMNNDDSFLWWLRDRNADMWGDDAAFTSPLHDPWWHLGWPDAGPDGVPDMYEAKLPIEWAKSADMSFRLTGIPIPEPASLGLVAMGALALLFRRKR